LTEVLNPAVGVAGGEARGSYAAAAQRLLNFVLFITVLTSSIVLVEPSPHDALMFVLAVMCVGARVQFDRKLIPLLILLIVWLTGGFSSLIQVGDQEKDIQYMGTSVYLAIAGLTFACLFSDGNLARLAILRRAYIIAALIATAAGYVGFFHLLPGADIFLIAGRVSGTFKDPNVYGPFLIYPLLLLIIGLITRGIRPASLVTVAVLLSGLFLSFSRGAWAHFIVSAAVAMAILVAITSNPRLRARIVLSGAAAAIAATLLVTALISIDLIHHLFVERAHVLQSYDVGPGGRFTDQRLALGFILEHPNGMGPFGFATVFLNQQHNVYMQGFLVYGWLGGAAYLTLVAVTLLLGLRVLAVPSPWQYYLIAAYATFVGEVGEGSIIDSDHWRHFFLLLGLVWGLSIATINSCRSMRFEPQGSSS
jgi:hypothetical protein